MHHRCTDRYARNLEIAHPGLARRTRDSSSVAEGETHTDENEKATENEVALIIAFVAYFGRHSALRSNEKKMSHRYWTASMAPSGSVLVT